MGLTIEVREIDLFDPSASRSALMRLSSDDTIAGFILDVWWYDSDSVRTSCLDVLAKLATFNKPVAILDELANG